VVIARLVAELVPGNGPLVHGFLVWTHCGHAARWDRDRAGRGSKPSEWTIIVQPLPFRYWLVRDLLNEIAGRIQLRQVGLHLKSEISH
jgi:hypothetical protein